MIFFLKAPLPKRSLTVLLLKVLTAVLTVVASAPRGVLAAVIQLVPQLLG
jgi:hypothetical protein